MTGPSQNSQREPTPVPSSSGPAAAEHKSVSPDATQHDGQLSQSLFPSPATAFIALHRIHSNESGKVCFDLLGLTQLQFIDRVEKLLGHQVLHGAVRGEIRAEQQRGIVSRESIVEKEVGSPPPSEERSPSWGQRMMGKITGLFGKKSEGMPGDGRLEIPEEVRGSTREKDTEAAPPPLRPTSNRGLIEVDGSVDDSRYDSVEGRKRKGLALVTIGDACAAHVAYALLTSRESDKPLDLFCGCGVQTSSGKVLRYNPHNQTLFLPDTGKKLEKSNYQQQNMIAGMTLKSELGDR